jgi:predicted transcriptional regulator
VGSPHKAIKAGIPPEQLNDMTVRNRIEIISQILEIANGGVNSKTKIMARANLSYLQLKNYLVILSEKDLLRYDFYTRSFKTTEKGLRFLTVYGQLDRIANE